MFCSETVNFDLPHTFILVKMKGLEYLEDKREKNFTAAVEDIFLRNVDNT